MAKKPASFEYNGTLVRVLDGDTIDCYGTIYGLTPKLQGKEKLIKKIKESGEA